MSSSEVKRLVTAAFSSLEELMGLLTLEPAMGALLPNWTARLAIAMPTSNLSAPAFRSGCVAAAAQETKLWSQIASISTRIHAE